MIPRFFPEVAFPRSTYVPGQTPHPAHVERSDRDLFISNTEPHDRPSLPDTTSESWPQCRAYLRGIDLFNHGYYWESHEAWEAVWHAVGRSGPIADLMKGLIKLAAAGVKTRAGLLNGRRRHCRRAVELFRAAADGLESDVQHEPRLMGLSLTTLARWASQAEQEPSGPLEIAGDPPRVFPFILNPSEDSA